MSWVKGFNFRAGQAFVTDGPDETWVLGFNTLYPTTRNGVTFGWTGGGTDIRDRNAGIDPRLAGTNLWTGGSTEFRVDLPYTGEFEIGLAMGDASFARSQMGVDVKDDTTPMISLLDMDPGAGQWFDASGVKRTSVSLWTGQHATVRVIFSTTTLNVQFTDTGETHMAHLLVREWQGYPFARSRAMRPHPWSPGLAR